MAITAAGAKGRNPCERNEALLLGQTHDITWVSPLPENCTYRTTHGLIVLSLLDHKLNKTPLQIHQLSSELPVMDAVVLQALIESPDDQAKRPDSRVAPGSPLSRLGDSSPP
jgi:hypothetical protein